MPAIQTNNNKRIEQFKANGGNDEQIHRRDLPRMIAQECSPALAWQAASPDHGLGYARLGDVEPELEQLSVDPRRSPERVLGTHAPDQHSQNRFDLRSSYART